MMVKAAGTGTARKGKYPQEVTPTVISTLLLHHLQWQCPGAGPVHATPRTSEVSILPWAQWPTFLLSEKLTEGDNACLKSLLLEDRGRRNGNPEPALAV